MNAYVIPMDTSQCYGLNKNDSKKSVSSLYEKHFFNDNVKQLNRDTL